MSVDLGVKVSCECGFEKIIAEPEGGQSLGGTAGDVGARHEKECNLSEKVKFQYGVIK